MACDDGGGGDDVQEADRLGPWCGCKRIFNIHDKINSPKEKHTVERDWGRTERLEQMFKIKTKTTAQTIAVANAEEHPNKYKFPENYLGFVERVLRLELSVQKGTKSMALTVVVRLFHST